VGGEINAQLEGIRDTDTSVDPPAGNTVLLPALFTPLPLPRPPPIPLLEAAKEDGIEETLTPQEKTRSDT
jgi:hypothetical protein